jgi:hypothetical protein
MSLLHFERAASDAIYNVVGVKYLFGIAGLILNKNIARN